LIICLHTPELKQPGTEFVINNQSRPVKLGNVPTGLTGWNTTFNLSIFCPYGIESVSKSEIDPASPQGGLL